MNTTINIKRIYEQPLPEDGYRVLVDRLWPRGITKEKAAIDEWNKAVAPSNELRKWFGHQAVLFEAFKKQYNTELLLQTAELKRLKEIGTKQNLTLLYAARDAHINHAIILLEAIKLNLI